MFLTLIAAFGLDTSLDSLANFLCLLGRSCLIIHLSSTSLNCLQRQIILKFYINIPTADRIALTHYYSYRYWIYFTYTSCALSPVPATLISPSNKMPGGPVAIAATSKFCFNVKAYEVHFQTLRDQYLPSIFHIVLTEPFLRHTDHELDDPNRIEAPITFKAYLMCAFASFGGIYFGYDSGYINGVMGMDYFVHTFTGKSYPGPNATSTEIDAFTIPASKKSLIVSILSAGTFFGSCMFSPTTTTALETSWLTIMTVIAGDLADMIGRRLTIICGCAIFCVGVALQTAATAYGLLIAGRLVAGFGVGFVSAIIILYTSEIAPRKVRGAIVSGYQFCITIGLLLASCVTYGTQHYANSGSYRIPIAIQLLWAIILGMIFLWR
jgi:hypothetical protein